MIDLPSILSAIDNQIAVLTKARNLLSGEGTSTTNDISKRGHGLPIGSTSAKRVTRPRKPLSEEGRARIIAAQKARWAKARKAGK